MVLTVLQKKVPPLEIPQLGKRLSRPIDQPAFCLFSNFIFGPRRMADLLAQVIEVQNRLTAPLAPFFLGQGGSCPLSVTFGKHFVAYYPAWVLVLLVQWAVLRIVFTKSSKGLLRRMGLTPIRAQRSTNALWSSGTSIGAMMLCASQIESVDPFTISFPTTSDWPPPHLAMYLAVLTTCQAQQIFSQLKTGYFGTEILTETSQVAVLVTTYCARWADFGFLLCFYLSCLQAVLQLGRLVLSFKRGTYYGALLIFYFYSLLWLVFYGFCIPLWINLVATTSIPDENLHFGLISLLASLVLHFICAAAFSPLFIAIKGAVCQKPMREWLEASMFPNIDWKLTKLKKEISEEELSRQNSFKRNKAQGSKDINQGKALMQILRCSSLLKRKVRAMRERKESTESESSHDDKSEDN